MAGIFDDGHDVRFDSDIDHQLSGYTGSAGETGKSIEIGLMILKWSNG